MRFWYRPIVAGPLEDGDFRFLLRPEIPVSIGGPKGFRIYSGLVDTGSDDTILPASAARVLGIPLRTESTLEATTFDGTSVRLKTGDVIFELANDDEAERIRWRTDVAFYDFDDPEDETVILGHAGFLDFFTATFDGLSGTLTLTPNAELPAV